VRIFLLVGMMSLTCAVSLMAESGPEFTCPTGQQDMMKYFVMDQARRSHEFVKGSANSIYTEVFPDRDFAPEGRWFWLKSAAGNGFDVKAFNQERIFMRATELTWTDNTSFKRFERDLPIAARCVEEGKPGPQIRVENTNFQYFAACKPYKSSQLGTAVNDLDAPQLMDAGGNIGQAWTRVLHYRYNCDRNFEKCGDEEQFYLANGIGLWQWKHYRNGSLKKTTLMNELKSGSAQESLPCKESYQ
jgi:hypothetical protein